MFHWLKKKPNEEEAYYDDLERRKREAAPALGYELSSGPSDRQAGEKNVRFCMTVDDVFAVRGRGAVVVGEITSGQVSKGDVVTILGACGSSEARVDGIERVRKIVNTARAGDHVGLLMRSIAPEQVAPGDTLIVE